MLNQDPLWYKDAVFYELHVRAFYDGNDDGVGDFAGLIQKLDYLEWLGVDCLWLLPFYPSPLRDDGYDVADFRSIAAAYGTIEDFRRLLDEAHRRGMRVIVDLILNHTSDQHAWFQAARTSPDSPTRHYYVWSDTDQKYARPESFLSIPRNPTGPGTQKRKPTSGIASSVINRISTMITRKSAAP